MLESMSSLQLSLAAIGALTVGAVVVYNYWTSRKNAPRQADPHRDPPLDSALNAIEPVLNADQAVPVSSTDAIDPVLQDAFAHLSQPDRKPQLDALIDVLASIEVDQAVSGDAALAALPTTRRVGTKLFSVEGFVQGTGQWEALAAGRRYNAFQAGVQLANRVGALNNIEFSEFVVKTQAFADAIGGSASFSDMLEDVARAKELDQFAVELHAVCPHRSLEPWLHSSACCSLGLCSRCHTRPHGFACLGARPASCPFAHL
jgi:hypothetical protein